VERGQRLRWSSWGTRPERCSSTSRECTTHPKVAAFPIAVRSCRKMRGKGRKEDRSALIARERARNQTVSSPVTFYVRRRLTRNESRYKTDNQGIKVQSILRISCYVSRKNRRREVSFENGFIRGEQERGRARTHLRLIDLVVDSDILRVDRLDLFDLGLLSFLHLDELIGVKWFGRGREGLEGSVNEEREGRRTSLVLCGGGGGDGRSRFVRRWRVLDRTRMKRARCGWRSRTKRKSCQREASDEIRGREGRNWVNARHVSSASVQL